MLPTILKSYGRATEIFAASEKEWHGLFVETPHGPRFLHPRELAVAQSYPWGFTLPSCYSQAWQFIGNSIPPPMAYLGLLRPAATLQGWGQTRGGGNWAADGFLRCFRASDGAWGAPPEGPGPAQRMQSPGKSRSPPVHWLGPTGWKASSACARQGRGPPRWTCYRAGGQEKVKLSHHYLDRPPLA